jgi:2-desacetyl-2-hydroxyethyl bacteriochlorophyllide A dehydrogenase
MEGRAHYVTGGGFAKYTIWPEQQLHKVPKEIATRDAVMMEPAAGCVHSAVTRMGVRPGESVLVMGPGARGLLLTQVSRAVGAGPVYVSGLTRDEAFRLPLAKQMGADEVVNAERTALRTWIDELTGGTGVDVVLENAGTAGAIEESLDVVRKGGRVLWAGGGIRGGIIARVDTYKIIVKELDVRGEISQIPYDWLAALYLASVGKLSLSQLVTHVFPLDRWQEAFDLAATDPKCLRVALQP